MAWREAFISLLHSPKILSMTGGLVATGSYVAYTDDMRFRRMLQTYSTGRILPPFTQNNYEVVYFRRPELENSLRKMLSSEFTNEYYLVSGESGSGKTRTVVEVVRDMMHKEGRSNKGAPVFVLSVQGKNFPETLANAVNFYFDEHVSFAFFLDFVMRVQNFPSREDHNRLVRVLDAIEKSAFRYMNRHGRPVVIVIDGANSLVQYMPGALEKLQEKAKLWADSNVAKVVLISNCQEVEFSLQKQSSNWSRAGTPLVVGDLSDEEAIDFLTSPHFMENSELQKTMSIEDAKKIVDLVGGRIHNLIVCKRSWAFGKPLEDTLSDLMKREREKFVNVSRRPSLWNVISTLRQAPNRKMLLSKLIKESSEAEVQALLKENVLRCGRDAQGSTVHFQSRLTERVVADLQRVYLREKNQVKS